MEHKIDTRIVLFDAEGKKIGETFSRRARQLVKQQRAYWTDESHTAIRFVPDAAEEWEASESWETPAAEGLPHAPDAALLELAGKRISSRRWFYIHALALIPGYIFLAMLSEVWFWRQSDNFVQGIFVGAAFVLWTVTFVYTIFRLIKYNNGFYPFAGSKNRHAIRLAAEVEYMRSIGYHK
jgi:hypothetical protein